MTELDNETCFDEDLENLATTKFIPSDSNKDDDDDDAIEIARSGDSCVHEPIIDFMQSPGFAGDDTGYDAFFKNQLITDEAGGLKTMLKLATVEMLKTPTLWMRIAEESMKWERTNRASELSLVEYAVQSIDSRPSQLHFNCKRLIERDVPNIIQDCLSVDPAKSTRSLLRMSIRTEMPLCQILSQLDDLTAKIPGFEVQKGMVTALLDGNSQEFLKGYKTNKIVSNKASLKLITPDYINYSYFETVLENVHIHRMTSFVRLKCTIRGRKHVRVNVTVSNEFTATKKRLKIIDIEQHVWPSNFSMIRRHVTFAPPEQNIIHEYEIPCDAPFIPLARSKPIHDLIAYLASVDEREHNIAENVY